MCVVAGSRVWRPSVEWRVINLVKLGCRCCGYRRRLGFLFRRLAEPDEDVVVESSGEVLLPSLLKVELKVSALSFTHAVPVCPFLVSCLSREKDVMDGVREGKREDGALTRSPDNIGSGLFVAAVAAASRLPRQHAGRHRLVSRIFASPWSRRRRGQR